MGKTPINSLFIRKYPDRSCLLLIDRICAEMAELSITARDYAKAINFYKEGLTYDETYLPVRRKIQI